MENNKEFDLEIVDDEGKTRRCNVLFTYSSDETGKDYVVFYAADNLDDESEDVDLFAYSYVEHADGEGELFALEDDEEVEMINDVIDQYFEEQAQAEENDAE